MGHLGQPSQSSRMEMQYAIHYPAITPINMLHKAFQGRTSPHTQTSHVVLFCFLRCLAFTEVKFFVRGVCCQLITVDCRCLRHSRGFLHSIGRHPKCVPFDPDYNTNAPPRHSPSSSTPMLTEGGLLSSVQGDVQDSPPAAPAPFP